MEIRNDAEHRQMISLLESMSSTKNPSLEMLERYRVLANIVERYEMEYHEPEPPTLIQAVHSKMNEMGIKNQRELADILGLPSSRVSQLMNKKINPTVGMLKIFYHKLKISPEILLAED